MAEGAFTRKRGRSPTNAKVRLHDADFRPYPKNFASPPLNRRSRGPMEER